MTAVLSCPGFTIFEHVKKMKYSEHPWYKQRGYLHFDIPVSLPHALDIVSNPNYIASHSFYPFINFTALSFKIKKDPVNGSLQKSEKPRAIAYSSHIDSHIFAYYAATLEILYEIQIQNHDLHKNVLAFRKLNKSNIEFAFDAFEQIRKRKDCSAVALDLSKFFDTLDHNLLKDAWCRLLGTEILPNDHYAVFKILQNILKSIKIIFTNYSTYRSTTLNSIEKGFVLLKISVQKSGTVA